MTDAYPYIKLAEKGAPLPELQKAADHLQLPPPEGPAFWNRIANDQSYPDLQRGFAIYQLFKRHVRAGMHLSGLASVLGRPRWLRPDDIEKKLIPVEWAFRRNPNYPSTGLLIRIHTRIDSGEGHAIVSIQLRVYGDFDEDQIRGLLLEQRVPLVWDPVILEGILCDSDDELWFNLANPVPARPPFGELPPPTPQEIRALGLESLDIPPTCSIANLLLGHRARCQLGDPVSGYPALEVGLLIPFVSDDLSLLTGGHPSPSPPARSGDEAPFQAGVKRRQKVSLSIYGVK